MTAIFRSLFHGCRSLLKWGVTFTVLVALPATFYALYRVDEEIRIEVERMLAEKYPHLVVRVRSARRRGDEGIEIRGLSIFEPNATEPSTELVYIDELFAQFPSDWQHLLQKQFDVRRLVFRRPIVRMSRLRGGGWNTAKLLPLPKFSDRSPEIVVEGATVEITDPYRRPPSRLVVRDAHVSVASPENDKAASGRAFQGVARGDHVGQIVFRGTLAKGGRQWYLESTVKDLEISPELEASLPGVVSTEKIDWLRSSHAIADASVRIDYDAARPQPLRFAASGRFRRGRVRHPRLPYPLNDVHGRFACDQHHFELQEFAGRNGPTQVRLWLRQNGYTTKSPWQLKADCRHLVVNAALRDALPAEWREQWHRFLPEGVVDVELSSEFDGATWTPHWRVHCRDIAFTYYKFPYRLERATGVIDLQPSHVRLDLLAYSGNDEVRIEGQFAGVDPEAPGEIRIRAERLPLDRKMFAAMTPKMREVISSFQPEGELRVDAQFWRQVGQGGPLHHRWSIDLNHGKVRYARFPYPLDNVRGTILCNDNEWTFRGFEGSNDTAHVTLEGWLRKTSAGSQWLVDLEGQRVPLEAELRAATQPALQRLWDDLALRGAVDLSMRLHKQPADERPRLTVRVRPLGGDTSVEPRFFPYRLESLRGSILYDNGSLVIEQLRARHGRLQLSTRGRCELFANGGWHVRLDRLDVDRLEFDRQLRAALPRELDDMIARWNPNGPLYLHGTLDLTSAASPTADPNAVVETARPIQATWDMGVDLHRVAVRYGVGLQDINGTVRLVGQYRQQQILCSGELQLDSFIYRNVQFTDVRGPLWIDNARALLGTEASRRRGEPRPRHVTARVVGGMVVGDGWIRFGEPSQFGLAATLSGGDLAQVAKEAMSGRQQLRGKITAGIELTGSGHGRHTLSGRGYVRLTEADIYRLPQMVALLKILSVRLPDTNAFTDSDLDFWIDAGHVYFNRVNFNGDAISLIGSGQMSPDGNLALTFYTMVGRTRLDVPIVRDVFRGASQQFMLVRVEGPWTDPTIRREPFPGVNQALEQIQAELMQRGPRQRVLPRIRQPPWPTSPSTAAARPAAQLPRFPRR